MALMGSLAQVTPPSPHLGRQGMNVSGIKSRQCGYPQDPSPEPTYPVNLVKPNLLRIPQASLHGTKVSPSPLPAATRGFPMHMEARRPVREYRAVRDLRHHLEINLIAMGRRQEHHLHDLAIFPLDIHILKAPSFPLRLDPKDRDIPISHRHLASPLTQVGCRHL